MIPDKGRDQHLDSMLTGLAMFEAYAQRDTTALKGMVDATTPGEAVEALLGSMEMVFDIFAKTIGAETEQVVASVRRRIVFDLAKPRPADG